MATSPQIVYESLTMHDSYLPTEILMIVIENIISEFAETRPKDSKYVRFIPQWYLTPLLRVSKQWYAVCVSYLYRSVAIGSHAPFNFPARKGEKNSQTHRRLKVANKQARKGDEVARNLCRTLKTCPRLAALVENLQLGVQKSLYDLNAYAWMKTNRRILRLCPNVKHVELRGFQVSKFRALVNVLKEKSLVSFCISPSRLSDYNYRRGESFSQILEMIQKWPNLRSIKAEDFVNDEAVNDPGPAWSDSLQASNRCCPDLTELIITGASLFPSELKHLHAMCSRDVEKLDLSLYGVRVGGNGDAAAAALCECLRAWSPSLQCLKISIQDRHDPYPPMSEAIASLCELRELQVNWTLDFGFISNLPRLERLVCHFQEDPVALGINLYNLSRHLAMPETFACLRHIALPLGGLDPLDELRGICRGKNIQLHDCWPGTMLTADFLL